MPVFLAWVTLSGKPTGGCWSKDRIRSTTDKKTATFG